VRESETIIEAMRQAVAPGKARLSDSDATALRDLTAALMAARPHAESEYQRFLAIAGRSLSLPDEQLTARLSGATVLVTGGTGCIGSMLITQLARYQPARVVSVSRGVTGAVRRHEGAEYLTADVTDRGATERMVAEVRPDVVFHVAAQRSPGLAEAEVRRTVSTNVLGARNVLAAASRAGVRQVVLASTGKALRPYSPEVYTASKRAAEWLGATAAASGEMTCSAARFTHVIDNSIIHGRLLDWAADEANGAALIDAPGRAAIRLHSPDIAFYAQSALESAQLLLIAMLGAVPGQFRLHAITDLGWPVSLLDVALGVLAATHSRTPVYVSGYDPGYEEVPFPGLYDPATSGDVSPLLNAFETAAVAPNLFPMVDAFRLEMAAGPAAPKLLASIETACDRGLGDHTIRQALDDLSWSLLDATLAIAPPTALARCATLIRPHESAISPTHRRILRAINAHTVSQP
jgi:nucleoside-diphosphate-sugar epimerase